MIPHEWKANVLARNVVIAETAVVDVVGVAIVVEMNVRVPRTVRRPGSVRPETNVVPPRGRPLREAIPVVGRAAREVGIVPAAIVVLEKIGHVLSIAATNLDRSRPPVRP